jgi:hypothetical protein
MVDYINPPIICVLGERGAGKNLFMTAFAYMYDKVDKLSIFSNYHLIGIPYKYITFEDLASLPEYLNNSVVFMDEAHIGADAYEAFRKNVKAITTFSTQLRKRNIIFFWSTQRFNTVAKRLRQMTNYVVEVDKTHITGVINCRIYDRQQPASSSFINEFILDGRKFYNMYDTNEIIE